MAPVRDEILPDAPDVPDTLPYAEHTLIRHSGTRKKSAHIKTCVRCDLYNYKYVRKTADLCFSCSKLDGSEQLLCFVSYVPYYKNVMRALFVAFNLGADDSRGIY